VTALGQLLGQLCQQCEGNGYTAFPIQIEKVDTGYRVTTAHNLVEARRYVVDVDEEGNELNRRTLPEAAADFQE
jgi:hypothetical protein